MSIHENPGDHYQMLASVLNRDSGCVTLNESALLQPLEQDIELLAVHHLLAHERPHMFAQVPYFVSRRQIERMAELIHAIESVIALPAYQETAFSWAPEIARFDPGPTGVFFGYDFHLQEAGPRLIEINTNAGGPLLNTTYARAQRVFSRNINHPSHSRDAITRLEQEFFDIFQVEWQRQRGSEPLNNIAIVDSSPDTQYLGPEFALFKGLFQRNGITAVIADPSELKYQNGAIFYRDLKVDLIYNRLTDFSLTDPLHKDIRKAYLNSEVVLTPHPRAHALYADKRNLTLLTDNERLKSWGVSEGLRTLLLSGVPRTVRVNDSDVEALWSQRRKLFFKPAAGYGGKATYRGDKLTRRVWQDILDGDYVAQDLVPPSQRKWYAGGQPVTLKADLRNYVYNGRVQLLTARLYQGQTTNFRTTGGGFATVYEINDESSCVLQRAASGAGLPLSVNPYHFYSHGQPKT